MKICPKCSSANNDTSEFCQHCGYQFNSAMNYSAGDEVHQPESQTVEKMKFCTSCGAQIPLSATVCPKCGTNIGPSSVYQHTTERPFGVVLIAIIGILAGIVTVAMASFVGLLIPIGGLPIAIIGIIFLFVSISLFTGKNWSRILLMIFSVIFLINFPIGTIIGLLFLYYLTRPHIYAYFHRTA